MTELRRKDVQELRAAIASQPATPPRGYMVQGEVHGLEGEGGTGELPHRGAHVVEKIRHGGDRNGQRVFYAVGPVRAGYTAYEEASLDCHNMTVTRGHLTAAQERIRDLEEWNSDLRDRVRELEEDGGHQKARIRELEEWKRSRVDLEGRLNRLRPLVRAAVKHYGKESDAMDEYSLLVEALDALTPADRAWAEEEA